MTSISAGAFAGFDGLTSITIPDSVKEIGDEAFTECCALESVTIIESVETLEANPFLWYCRLFEGRMVEMERTSKWSSESCSTET